MDWNFELVAGPYGSPTDGPVWDGESMLFTRMYDPANSIENRILRYNPQSGEVTDFRSWTNRTAGLTIADGILYGCQSGSRRVIRFNADGSASPLAHKVDGKYHNQAKDLVVDGLRRIWFADPIWGPPVQGGLRPHELEPMLVGYAAVLRMESPTRDAPIKRMTFDTTSPTSVLLSRDERILYVSENNNDEPGKRELRAYPILDDGSLGSYRVLHTFGADHKGVHRGIDGMCLDSAGNIVACAGWDRSGPGPLIYVFSPEGRVLETQRVPAGEPTNCAFGEGDLGALYVTTSEGHLYRVRDTGRRG